MKKILLTLALLSNICLLNAQIDDIIDNELEPQAEFDVAINPTDSANIIIATMHGFENLEESFLSVYYTEDFGTTWEKSAFTGQPGDFIASGDPVISFDAEGNAYIVNLGAGSDFNIATVLSKSTDNGETWNTIAEYGDETDKPWMDIDKDADSPYYGQIYIPVVGSDGMYLLVYDSLGTLLETTLIAQGDQLPSVAVGKGGDVFVSTVGLGNTNSIYVHHYTEQGRNLVTVEEVTTFPDYTFNASDVSGRYQPTVYLSIDNSDGPFEGRLYVSYTASELQDESKFDVFLMYTDDKGLTWSDPLIVHDDKTDGVQQFYSSSYVNDNGVLLLDWYDRAGFDPSSWLTNFKLGTSFDGGQSFQEVTLNSDPMDFMPMLAVKDGFGVGEYHQCVATKSKGISFWADGRSNDGDINIYYAIVGINNPVLGVEEVGLVTHDFSFDNIFPIPAFDKVTVEWTQKNSENIYWTLHDNLGKLVWRSDLSKYSGGKHQIEILLDLDPGQYNISARSTKGIIKSKQIQKI